MRHKFGKKLIVLMLAAAMIFNTIPAMAMSETNTKAKGLIGGGLSSMLTLDFSGLAQDYLERTIFLAIGKAIDAEGDSDLGKALTMAKKLMASPIGNSLGNITGLCEEMLQDLAVIEAKLDECNEKMDDFAASQHYADYQEKRVKLIAFKDTYNEIFNLFTGFLTAMDAYDKDPSEANYKAVQLAFEKVEAFYVDNPNVLNSEYTNLDFNFVNDLHGFLREISPYLPSQAVKTDVYPSDSAYWGDKQGTTTYLDTVFTCLKDYYPYEHQILAEMKTACSEVAGIANLYLTTHRMYTEIGAQMLAYDGTLTEDQRELEIASLWNIYQENAYKMVRGLEQLCELGDTYTDGYMTHLDTNATIKVDPTEDWYVEKKWSDNTSHYIYLEEKQITDDFLEFYQVKVPGDDKVYAILKGVSVNPYADGTELSNEDLIEVAIRKEAVGVETDYWSVSGDYLKLTNSGTNSEYNYSMISSAEDVKKLVGNARFGGHVYSYLQEHLQAADLPASSGEVAGFDDDAVKEGMVVPLKTSLDAWTPSNKGDDMHMDLPAVNIAMTLDLNNLNRSVVSLDAQADIADEDGNKTNPLVILKGDLPQFILGESFDQGKGDVEIVYEDGTAATGYLDAGTSLVAKVRPYSGKTIKSISLRRIDENNKLVTDEEPYYLAGGADAEDASLEEALESCQRDDEGYYHFNFTAPYVEAAVCVEFADATQTNAYTVLLNQDDHGVLMFADGGFGLTEREYHAGERVEVYVRPFTGYLCSGTGLSVNTEAAGGLFAPNMEAYYFTMPEHDVDVSANFAKAGIAELSTVNAGDGCSAHFVYEGSEAWDESWIRDIGTFAAGSTVSVAFTETEKYYFKEACITNYDSYDYVVGNVSGNTITFTMPDANVGVEVIYNQVEARSYTASLSSTGGGNLYFTDQSGKPLNSVKDTFEEGSTVTFTAVTDHHWDGQITAKDYAGNQVEITELGNNQYSFIMPGSNVYISTAFAEEITVSLESPTDVNAFYFVVDGEKSYRTSMTYWEGDTITVACYNEQYLNDYEVRVNEILAKDSDGKAVELAQSGTIANGYTNDKTYTMMAGDKDIQVYADYDVFVHAHFAEGFTAENFAFKGGDGWFPGGPVYFVWTGSGSAEDVIVTAVDAEGNEVAIIQGAMYTIYMPDSDVYITAEQCVNGVGISSGRYQAPLLNAEGYYEIRNAGHLMWFKDYVHNEDLSAKAVMMDNIDMTDIQNKWDALGKHLGGFNGIFDGKGFTIHNLKLDPERIRNFKEEYFITLGEHGEVKDVNFTFDPDYVEEEKPVETGDTANLCLWLVLLTAGTGIAVWLRKRKKA